MDRHVIAIIEVQGQGTSSRIKSSIFHCIDAQSLADIQRHEKNNDIEVAIISSIDSVDINSEDILVSKSYFNDLSIPVVLLQKNISLDQKIDALESGFHDIVSIEESDEELNLRLLAQVFHRTANEELKQNLDQANIAAFSAMTESSNLGNNIHFLLNAHQCSNLDELGLSFFQTISEYDLNCSLQMRSGFGDKNMEANGMERRLEAELLTQLKDTGRYYDFGNRSIVNYGCVSVLIKNMPEDEFRYGLIKDNTFTLLQGLDARVRAIDEHQKLANERDALKQLSQGITHAMKSLDVEYHAVMANILQAVEDMAEKIEGGISKLLLSEDQESFIEETIKRCIDESNKVFVDGLKIDQHFKDLEERINRVIKESEVENNPTPAEPENPGEAAANNLDIELF